MDYTVVDLEMTGLVPKRDKVIEIGAVKVRDGKITAVYETLVQPGKNIPEAVTKLTGITNEMVAQGKEEDIAMQQLIDFIGDDILVGHNLIFDYGFMKQWAVNRKIPLEMSACDTLKLARILLPAEQPKKLESLCTYFHIERRRAHRAVDDAEETYKIFEYLQKLAADKPEILTPRKLVYKAKKQSPATVHQKERLQELVQFFKIKDEICWESLTRSEASRMQDRIYATYGRIPQER